MCNSKNFRGYINEGSALVPSFGTVTFTDRQCDGYSIQAAEIFRNDFVKRGV